MTHPQAVRGQPPLSSEHTRDHRAFELRERDGGYTIVPSVVEDMGLHPCAYALYVHYRIASDRAGGIWESVRQLSGRLRVSPYLIRIAQAELRDRGLISLEPATRPDKRLGLRVTILDIWDDNASHVEGVVDAR